MVALAVVSARAFVAALPIAALLVSAVSAGATTLTLEEAIQQALQRAPKVRAAGSDAEAAAARVLGARAAYLPHLGAHGEYGHAFGFDEAVTNGGSTAAVVTLDATLLDGGLRAAQLASARAHLQAASALERQRQADVAEAVASAYFAAAEGRREVEIDDDHLRMLRDAVQLLQRQSDLGQVTRNDVLRTQLAMQAAAAAGRAAAAQAEIPDRELEILVGSPITAAAISSRDLPPLPEVSEISIDASPMVADALAAAEAAQHDADAARSEWRPQLTFNASGGALGVEPGTTFRENAGGQFLVGVTMPLFDGGVRSARTAEALAAARSATLAAEEIRQNVAMALARVRIEALRARTDATTWAQAADAAAENLTLMRARYAGGGDVRLLEVLDALGQSVDTRLNVARAELAYHLAVAAQHQLLGEIGP